MKHFFIFKITAAPNFSEKNAELNLNLFEFSRYG